MILVKNQGALFQQKVTFGIVNVIRGIVSIRVPLGVIMLKKYIYSIVAIAALQGAVHPSDESIMDKIKSLYVSTFLCTENMVGSIYSKCNLEKPDADTVEFSSLPLWFGHAAHGWRQHSNRYNEALKTHTIQSKVVTASTIDTPVCKANRKFSIYHPIQSMRTCKPKLWLPVLGPMLAAHATGIAYYGLVNNASVESVIEQPVKQQKSVSIMDRIRAKSLSNYDHNLR